jgi:thiamine biosynthesis lipoprotein
LKPLTFNHEAMATTFRIHLADQEPDYARKAAAAAFRELDRLESELSRYIESSDISRINRLPEGGSTVVGEATMACLTLAARLSALTGGTFDPAYASERPGPEAGAEPALYALDPAAHTLTSLCPRLHLDLGAVGKGYALDCMAEVLREWDVLAACLDSGGSTLLALSPPVGERGWPAGVGEGAHRRVFALRDRALAGSGLAVQGEHLCDPRTGQAASRRDRVWAFADSGAAADALSTAFFVLDDAGVVACCAAQPRIGAAIAQADGTVAYFGVTADD